jgi:hypothetical protein
MESKKRRALGKDTFARLQIQALAVSPIFRLPVTKCDARYLVKRVRLGEKMFAHAPFLLLWASGTSFAPRDSRSDPPGLRSHEPSGSQIARGRTPAFMRRRPRWVSRCSVHAPLSKSPQPRPNAKGAGVPERKIGFEALEASAKLRISSKALSAERKA